MAQGFNPNEPVTGGTALGSLYAMLRRLLTALFTLHCGDSDPDNLMEGVPYLRRITGGHALRYFDGTAKRGIGDAIEELVSARGTGASLAARLDSALNPDGTLKNPAPSGGWWERHDRPGLRLGRLVHPHRGPARGLPGQAGRPSPGLGPDLHHRLRHRRGLRPPALPPCP